jgi:hypothetical protein
MEGDPKEENKGRGSRRKYLDEGGSDRSTQSRFEMRRKCWGQYPTEVKRKWGL